VPLIRVRNRVGVELLGTIFWRGCLKWQQVFLDVFCWRSLVISSARDLFVSSVVKSTARFFSFILMSRSTPLINNSLIDLRLENFSAERTAKCNAVFP